MGKTVELLKETQCLLVGSPELWVNGHPDGEHVCAVTAPGKVAGMQREHITAKLSYSYTAMERATKALGVAAQDQPYDGPRHNHLGGHWLSVSAFNDSPGRTLQEVIWLYDDAIDIAEERGW